MSRLRQGPFLVSRRTLLAAGPALATMVPMLGLARADTVADPLDPKPLIPSPQFDDVYAGIVGNGTPIEDRMTLEMPEDAENGSIVPYKIDIESPMTDTDRIARTYLLSTQNPQALVATFHFTPLSGRATVSGRMRLAKTQEVVAVALTSENRLLIARTLIHVGIGGCGVE